MSILKSIVKWSAILIAFFMLMLILQDVAGYVRVGIALGIFVGFLFHALNKRLDVIEGNLRRLSAQIEDRS